DGEERNSSGAVKDSAEPSDGSTRDREPKNDNTKPKEDSASKKEDKSGDQAIFNRLDLITERGVILINVPPSEVMSDLRERPLTEAAKAIIRSGDSILTEAIRRASPKYFGDYTKTLPPLKLPPEINRQNLQPASQNNPRPTVALISIADDNGKVRSDVSADDLVIEERSQPRAVKWVKPSTTPVNLVLLLDVSGSVENYVNFIRKAARAFIETVEPRDRIALVIFNDDVKVLSGFTRDKKRLSESLDTFDAGGATAFYDAIGFVLGDIIRPLKGERTAIVILSDGDDNRSFIPFEALVGSIKESGSVIFPLYVPSALIASSANDPLAWLDPLRSRYIGRGLTSRAESEGKRLAEVSGGKYYSIERLSEIQGAYDDIVFRLRSGFEVAFDSTLPIMPGGKPSPLLKIRTHNKNERVEIEQVRPEN
ncbi:MAG TPA: VWA domain-containing protein, partial [Pyrinomonadaceae bacterium]|nr:VWA domain-containing protein [Pyrinomonadaceae bacterium]